jgi:hypothetical protein
MRYFDSYASNSKLCSCLEEINRGGVLISLPKLSQLRPVKMRSLSIVLVLVAAASNAIAQFVPAPKDLISKIGYANVPVRYKQVPAGICELDPNVKSFTGYADVAYVTLRCVVGY